MKKICIIGSGYLGINLYRFLNENINNLYEIYLQPIREKIIFNLKDFDIIIDTADRARGIHNEVIKKKLDGIRTNKKLSNINYVYFSSIQIYNNLLNFVDENSAISPNNEYQLNKTNCEKLIINNKNKFAILRLPNIWSLNSPEGTFIGDQIIKLKESSPIQIHNKDFESFIDLVYIYDLFQIILDLIIKTTFKDLILNISSGYSLRISYIKECFSERKRMKLLKNNNYKEIFRTQKIKDLKLKIPLDFCYYYNKNIMQIYNEIDG